MELRPFHGWRLGYALLTSRVPVLQVYLPLSDEGFVRFVFGNRGVRQQKEARSPTLWSEEGFKNPIKKRRYSHVEARYPVVQIAVS
jgi:hypothetical protein